MKPLHLGLLASQQLLQLASKASKARSTWLATLQPWLLLVLLLLSVLLLLGDWQLLILLLPEHVVGVFVAAELHQLM